MKRLLKDGEMLQPIWDMGVALEKEGRQPEQIDRFRAIAKAQDKKTLKAVGEWLEPKASNLGASENVYYIVFEREVEALKRGEMCDD